MEQHGGDRQKDPQQMFSLTHADLEFLKRSFGSLEREVKSVKKEFEAKIQALSETFLKRLRELEKDFSRFVQGHSGDIAKLETRLEDHIKGPCSHVSQLKEENKKDVKEHERVFHERASNRVVTWISVTACLASVAALSLDRLIEYIVAMVKAGSGGG